MRSTPRQSDLIEKSLERDLDDTSDDALDPELIEFLIASDAEADRGEVVAMEDLLEKMRSRQ